MVGGSGELGDPEGTWLQAYDLEPDGAVLVRPDGYVGWRSRSGVDDPAQMLTQALDSILCLH